MAADLKKDPKDLENEEMTEEEREFRNMQELEKHGFKERK